MDPRAQMIQAAMSFMTENGIVILGSTIAAGVTLGPEGALLGGLLAGAGITVRTLISSPWWGRFAQLLIGNLQLLFPLFRDRMHVFRELLDKVAELLVRLMRRTGFLPASEVRQVMAPRRDRDPSPTSH